MRREESDDSFTGQPGVWQRILITTDTNIFIDDSTGVHYDWGT